MAQIPSNLSVQFHDLTEDGLHGVGQHLARTLQPGLSVLLHGDLGAGKSSFSRALISSILPQPEDIPSPTYTLVQSYDTTLGSLVHADLYRLGDPEETVELGLQEAFLSSICLIEWPDRLGDYTPEERIDLYLSPGASHDLRDVTLRPSGARSAKAVTDAFVDA